MGFWDETKFLLQRISQVLHFGEIAAFVIFQHSLEDVDNQKCCCLEFLFSFWIWRINNFTTKIGKLNLFRTARTLCEAIVARRRSQIEPRVSARTCSNRFSYFISLPRISAIVRLDGVRYFQSFLQRGTRKRPTGPRLLFGVGSPTRANLISAPFEILQIPTVDVPSDANGAEQQSRSNNCILKPEL